MLTGLVCERCGARTPADPASWRCPACEGPLRWDGPTTFQRIEIRSELPSLWRYAAALPVAVERAVSLGEPITPLVEGAIEGQPVRFKLDFLMPTGSFKDRGSTVLISHLRQAGVESAVEDSSGNAAASIAAYAARAGIGCTVFAPAAASPGKLVQAAAYGARVARVGGSREDVAAAAVAAARAPGVSYASHNWHPFFIEGVKIWALEVWEQLGFRAPDNVIVPVGAGSMLLGAWRAFSMLQESGEIARPPRLFAAQAAACAPLVDALDRGATAVTPATKTATLAEGIVIANPIRGQALLGAVRASGGGGVAVTEPEIAGALRMLGRQGLYVEPTSAVAAAAAHRLLQAGTIHAGQTTVVLLSGSGLKATEAIGGLLAAPA